MNNQWVLVVIKPNATTNFLVSGYKLRRRLYRFLEGITPKLFVHLVHFRVRSALNNKNDNKIYRKRNQVIFFKQLLIRTGE